MKKKWLVNVITLALCICAMAIGVYAAKQASLTVNGQIGFEAHNCKVQVSGTVNAYNQEGNAKLTGTDATLPTTIVDGKAETVTFPTAIYFSDMEEGGDTISLNLTITNLSAFAIDGKVNSPVFKLGTTVSTMVTSAVSSSSFTLEPDANTPVTITFTLSNIQSVDSITNGNYQLFMEFEKSVPGVKSNIQISNLTGNTSKEVSSKANPNAELTTSTISFGDMTPNKVNDVVSDISISTTLTNSTDKKAYVEISAPTGLPTGVELSTKQQFVKLPFKTYLAPNSSKTLTFGLTTTGTTQIPVNSSSITVSVKEDTSTASTLFQYEDGLGWYATMGTNPWSDYNEPLRWFPIAITNTTSLNKDTIPTYTATTRTNNNGMSTCPSINSSYYLISQYVLSTIAKPFYDSNIWCNIEGVPYNFYNDSDYNAAYYDGSTWQTVYANNGSTIKANDYSVSNLRAYLTGSRTAYYQIADDSAPGLGKEGTELPSFEEQYNVANSELYNYIFVRSQTSLYVNNGFPSGRTTYVESSLSNNNGDRFWPLSANETALYIGTSSSVLLTYLLSENVLTYAMSWWLRSPSVSTAYMAGGGYEFEDDELASRPIYFSDGVRPAVQIVATV